MSAPAPIPVPAAAGDEENAGRTARAALARLAAAPPGVEVLAAAERITAAGVGALSESELVDLAVALERCEAWLYAVKQPVFAALGRAAGHRTHAPGRFEDVSLEMALALRWSEWMCADRMHTARLLEERLPDTLEALGAGRITPLQAKALVDGADLLAHPDAADPIAAAADLEARVLPTAAEQTRAETAKAVGRAVMAIDPAAVEERRVQSHRDRGVFRTGGPQTFADRLEGRAGLFGQGPAEDVLTIWQGLSVGADRLVALGEVDTLSQGRFDTLLSWATGFLRDQPTPARGSRPTSITLIARETTLAGEDEEPAELVGYGPITAQAFRDLARGVPPRPGPFTVPTSPVDAGTVQSYRYVLADERDDPEDIDAVVGEDEYGDPHGPDTRDDEPPDPDGGGGGSGGGGGGPPPSGSDGVPADAPVRLRLLLTDPDTGYAVPRPGLRLDYGVSRRLFPTAVVDHLKDKYRVCAFPGCNAPAHTLEGDHWTGAAAGGWTDAMTNGGPTCAHHNRTTRNRPGWTITPNGDGTATLTTPHGRSYPITPFDYRTM